MQSKRQLLRNEVEIHKDWVQRRPRTGCWIFTPDKWNETTPHLSGTYGQDQDGLHVTPYIIVPLWCTSCTSHTTPYVNMKMHSAIFYCTVTFHTPCRTLNLCTKYNLKYTSLHVYLTYVPVTLHVNSETNVFDGIWKQISLKRIRLIRRLTFSNTASYRSLQTQMSIANDFNGCIRSWAKTRIAKIPAE